LNPGNGLPDASTNISCTCQTIIDGRRASRTLADWVRRFELTEPAFLVLWSLREALARGMDQSMLAQRLVVSPAQISATVEQLSALGLIAQQPLTADRRRRLWQLSASGHARLAAMLRDSSSVGFPPAREAAA
jgi:DNA-binding MarR family transcriptional regulator